MNKYLMVTLGVDGSLSDNARGSHEDAAERWQCDYHVGLQRYWPKAWYSYSKFPHLCDDRYSRILWVDSDILIRADAPSPFNLVPRDHIGLVEDAQPHHSEEIKKRVIESVHNLWYEKIRDFGFRHGLSEVPRSVFLHRPTNAGWVIACPEHHAWAFQKLGAMIPSMNAEEIGGGHFEQALFNYGLRALGVPIFLMEPTWNTIRPDVSDGVMRSFCYHFTGVDFVEFKPLRATYDWRTNPPL